MATRVKGEGSVYRRKSDGRFVAVADLGVGLDGKRVRRTFYGATDTEAVKRRKAWLNSAEAQRESRRGTGAVTVAEAIKAYLAALESTAKRGTFKVRKVALDVHAKAAIGSMRIDRVKDSDISTLYVKLRRKNKPGSIRTVHAGLRQFFRWAVERKLIAVSPMVGVKQPKDDRKRKIKAWTPAEGRALIAAMHSRPFGSVFAFMLRTGLRPGEAYALQWEAVDLERKTIRVEATMHDDGELGPPKTESSERTIQIDDGALNILRAIPWRDGLVFRARGGKPINEGSARRALKSYCKGVVPIFSPHSCRHSHATWLLLDGVPPHEVAARLGHKDATETMQTYAHFLPTEARAADSIARTLG